MGTQQHPVYLSQDGAVAPPASSRRVTRCAAVAGLAGVASLGGPAAAQAPAWPTKAVRFLVGFAPGGGTDIMARAVAVRLADALGQQVVVENRPGANANLAAEIAAKAPPDGYTVLFISVSHAVSKSLYRNLKYDLERDFIPLAGIGSVPQALVVNPSLPVRSVKDLIALARKRPGEVTYASSGSGSPEHLAGEMFALMAGVKLLHVPFKGGAPSAAAIVGGEVSVGFNTMPVALPHIQSGRMRVLATTEDRRAGVLPDVPTIAEAGVTGYAASTWYGAMLPTGTPREIVLRLNTEINKVLQIAEVRDRLLSLGAVTLGGTPEAFGTLISTDVAKFAKVVKAANMQVE
ncbi:MAG: tripartite tricarboxylate transporter substrate binding protein [bacterium]|jgi:tripartite-type tricarboxylate transporter receptor subunit TctC|nr:tripartite tricarboxylate transporter substrate binding protein [Betaproteobacteria bacterium]